MKLTKSQRNTAKRKEKVAAIRRAAARRDLQPADYVYHLGDGPGRELTFFSNFDLDTDAGANADARLT